MWEGERGGGVLLLVSEEQPRAACLSGLDLYFILRVSKLRSALKENASMSCLASAKNMVMSWQGQVPLQKCV